LSWAGLSLILILSYPASLCNVRAHLQKIDGVCPTPSPSGELKQSTHTGIEVVTVSTTASTRADKHVSWSQHSEGKARKVRPKRVITFQIFCTCPSLYLHSFLVGGFA